MIVYITNSQKDLAVDETQIERIACQVVQFEGHTFDEASIQLVETKEICSLHDQYFDDPSPTDCISFPMDMDDGEGAVAGYRVLGDVIVCPRTAIEYSVANGLDVYEELTLYIVHGLLHLMGYDDLIEEDIKSMRSAEERHMKNLKKLDLCLRS